MDLALDVLLSVVDDLVLVMLVIYLGAMFYSGRDPYQDREFLMVFNALLIGVMAIIFFSQIGQSGNCFSCSLFILRDLIRHSILTLLQKIN